MSNEILKAEGVQKFYQLVDRRLDILNKVAISVKENEFVAIVGPSGAGKSTLLHILGGLDKPNGGNVFLNDQNVYKLNDAKRARLRNEQVGFVFQFYHLLPEFDALENVLLPMLVQSGQQKKMDEIREEGKKMLAQVGLESRMTHKPYELSGGEQQRVAIARALINDPQVILCDEPTGNLDSQSGKEIIDLLFKFQKEKKKTVVIVTHDEHIARQSDRMFKMRDGQLFEMQKVI